MTDDEQKTIDEIERKRRRREAALLALLLLAISGGAVVSGNQRLKRRSLLSRLNSAVDHGLPLQPVVRDTILGNASLNLPGIQGFIAAAMADAAIEAELNVFKQAGIKQPIKPDAMAELVKYFASAAMQQAEQIALELTSLVNGWIETAKDQGVKLSDWFTRYGWTQKDPCDVNPESKGLPAYQAAGHATDAILAAWKYGNGTGFANPLVTEKLTALRHVSVMDNRTTHICEERNGLTLPPDDPYFKTNWPSLHPRCRSVIIGIFWPVKFSTAYPITPPQQGWGLAPPGYLDSLS